MTQAALKHVETMAFAGNGHADKQAQDALAVFIDGLATREPQRLLLINPPQIPQRWFESQVAVMRRYHNYPPTGLLYLAAIAREVKPDIELRILDLNHDLLRRSTQSGFVYDAWKDQLKKELDITPSLWVGISCMFSHSLEAFYEIVDFIAHNAPSATLIAGGVQSTFACDEILRTTACDAVVRHEGELQLKALLESSGEIKPTTIPWGTVCRLPDQTIYEFDISRRSPVAVDLDITPYYSLIEIENYSKFGALGAFSRYVGLDSPFCAVIRNRGCRARCTFCTVRNFNGAGIRGRNHRQVIDEIKYLWQEKGIRRIDWLDDDLLYDADGAVALFKGLSEEVPELEWVCNNGLIAGAINEELLYWMVRSGMKAFTIGIESGNSEVLTKIRKPASRRNLRRVRKLFDQYPDVLATANFVIGFPNETFGQMLDTLELAIELRLDWARYFICQPMQGAEMFTSFQALGDARVDHKRSEDINPIKADRESQLDEADDEKILYGMDIFAISPDMIPSHMQLKEIWFTFNIVSNVLRNPNLSLSGNPKKLLKWVESILASYPYDAALCACMAYGSRLLGDLEAGKRYEDNFKQILADSDYWKKRSRQFPELFRLANHFPDRK